MKFFTRIAILLYVTFMLFSSCFILLFVLDVVDPRLIVEALNAIIADDNLKLSLGIMSVVLLLINFGVYRYFSVNVHRDKIIAFDNPSGRVSVSLLAIEDLVKKLLVKMIEVHEVKTAIRATRKGLIVKIKMTVRADINIPDMTTKVQDMVKEKLQDTIGIDEPMDISIYVNRIVGDPQKEKVAKPKEDKDTTTFVPFHGYRP